MVQRAVRAEGTPPWADPPSSDGAEELGRDWVILKDCRLGRPARGGHLPAVLMHPARGVAVLDILPSDTPGAAEALRARLAAARFPAIFAGHLPVVHLQVAPRRVPFLASLLDEAFAAQPPLDLPGGDAWVGVAARALTAEQPVPRLETPRQIRGAAAGRPGRRPRRRTAAALRKAGAVLLCLAALGGALGLALNKAPAPEAVPPAAVEAVPRTPVPPAPPSPAPAPVPIAPPPLPAPPARSEAATVTEPAPEPPPPARPLPAVDVPPLPALLQRPAPPPPSRRPEAAGPSTAPAARRAPERTVPQRPRQDAGTGRPAAAGGADAALRLPETPPDRCRRVSALVGSGAPLADADMRFFNGNCIRWE